MPNLYSFNKDNDLEFASTILLLNRYWDSLKERTDNNSELRSEFIPILRKMAIVYVQTVYVGLREDKPAEQVRRELKA